MNWPQIFLGCFVVGFALSALSFALGAAHAHLNIHVPWGHHIHGHMFHPEHPGAEAMSPINFATIMAFLAWFGGTGFLLTTTFGWTGRGHDCVLDHGPRAVVAAREHDERRLPHGRRARPPDTAHSRRRGNRRAGVLAQWRPSLVRREE